MSMIPLVAPEPWTVHRACTPDDLHLFYPTGTTSRRVRLMKERAAKRICAFCPVRDECLGYALRIGDEEGIFGGMTGEERRDRRRGLPRPCRMCGELFSSSPLSGRGSLIQFCGPECRLASVRASKAASSTRRRGVA